MNWSVTDPQNPGQRLVGVYPTSHQVSWAQLFLPALLPTQAFSHFTFERSGHQLIVVDIQGVGDLYTDPQIHTEMGTDFGDGNLGGWKSSLFFGGTIPGKAPGLLLTLHSGIDPGSAQGTMSGAGVFQPKGKAASSPLYYHS